MDVVATSITATQQVWHCSLMPADTKGFCPWHWPLLVFKTGRLYAKSKLRVAPDLWGLWTENYLGKCYLYQPVSMLRTVPAIQEQRWQICGLQSVAWHFLFCCYRWSLWLLNSTNKRRLNILCERSGVFLAQVRNYISYFVHLQMWGTHGWQRKEDWSKSLTTLTLGGNQLFSPASIK